jgi:hypothetical protein
VDNLAGAISGRNSACGKGSKLTTATLSSSRESEFTTVADQCLVSKVQTVKVADGYYGPDTFFPGLFTWPVADDFHV